MKKETKVKATLVTLGGMTGISVKNVTFHDFENRIFVYGRERTKRQLKTLDNMAIFSGHLASEELEKMKMTQVDNGISRRCFPPSAEDLRNDLKVWEVLKNAEAIKFFDVGAEIEKEILKEA